MRRETRQLSLADALIGARGGARLDRIAVALDWDALGGLLADLRSAPTGRPGWPPLAMLKALLLAQWYGLSDPELEDALADRLSFRRFIGLPLDGGVPDETTLCRNELVRRGLTERLLAAVDAQLAARGLVLKRGTLIDASLVEADADVRKGPDGRPVTVEREAGFAKRRGKAFFGFKAHLAVDEGSGLVRRAILTPANVNETGVADALPIGDEAAVYADKGYDSAARHRLLAERGVFDGVMRRAYVGRPLTREEVARNRALVPIRCAIERVFGTLKRSYGWTRVRYRGLARNAAHLDLLCLALNLRRPHPVTAWAAIKARPQPGGRGTPRSRHESTAEPPQDRRIRTSRNLFRRGLSEQGACGALRDPVGLRPGAGEGRRAWPSLSIGARLPGWRVLNAPAPGGQARPDFATGQNRAETSASEPRWSCAPPVAGARAVA